jgi:hypothetical protein
MKSNKIIIYKIIDDFMTIIAINEYKNRERLTLIRTLIAYNRVVMIKMTFPLGMSNI